LSESLIRGRIAQVVLTEGWDRAPDRRL